MAKSCAISQSNYIPWKGYFDQINMVDDFVIYDCVQYTRRDWRNRNMIKTPTGPHWLTVPVESKGKYLARIDEMTIAESGWADSHWKAISMNYAKAPYFHEFKNELKELYEGAISTSLSDINRYFLDFVCSVLEIRTLITTSTEYELLEDRNDRLMHICKQLGATTYYSGPAAKSYLDEKLFVENGIEVIWMDYGNYPEYEQLHPPFEHAVSILDLLLNQGTDARKYMKSFDLALATKTGEL
jgi:hypothetical protein